MCHTTNIMDEKSSFVDVFLLPGNKMITIYDEKKLYDADYGNANENSFHLDEIFQICVFSLWTL